MATGTDAPAPRIEIGLPRARFVVVLGLLLGLIVLEVGFEFRQRSPLLMSVSSVSILAIALVAATGQRRLHQVVIALFAVAIIANGAGVAGIDPTHGSAGSAMSALLAGYATWRLFRGVVRSPRITGDVLAGALAAYVMAGLSFALVYSVIDANRPGSFLVPGGGAASFPDLVYFSFVALMTIGFGDVTPATGPARAVTLLEGLFGVVYTTVVLAALVAAYLGQHAGRTRRGEPE